jgi:hypothetical protein
MRTTRGTLIREPYRQMREKLSPYFRTASLSKDGRKVFDTLYEKPDATG